jgi:hypothetical protein
MAQVWKTYQGEHPETCNIVQAGLDKLDDYYDRTANTPAYAVSMSTFLWHFNTKSPNIYIYIVLNPAVKLEWLATHAALDATFLYQYLRLA